MSVQSQPNPSIISLKPLVVSKVGILLSRSWQSVNVQHQYPRTLSIPERSQLMAAELAIKWLASMDEAKTKNRSWLEVQMTMTRLSDLGWEFFWHAQDQNLTILIKKGHHSPDPPALALMQRAKMGYGQMKNEGDTKKISKNKCEKTTN